MTDRPVVYVTQQIHPDGLALLRKKAEVHVGFGPDAEPVANILDRVEGFLLRNDGIPPMPWTRRRGCARWPVPARVSRTSRSSPPAGVAYRC